MTKAADKLRSILRDTKEMLAAPFAGARGAHEDKATQYLVVDVVRFASHGTDEKLYIVDMLNKLVRESLAVHKVGKSERLCFPLSGDCVCVAFTNALTATADLNIAVAISLLGRLNTHNARVDLPANGCSFEVRIGLNRHTDTLVLDINGNPLLAGSGINNAQRVMSLADGGQILLSEADYHAVLNEDGFEPDSFRAFQSDLGDSLIVHQLRRDDIPWVNKETPRRFMPQRYTEALTAAVSDDRLALISPDVRRQGVHALVGSMFAEEAPGVSAFVEMVDTIASTPKLWRTKYQLRLNAEWVGTSDRRLRVRARCSWEYENYSDQPITYRQPFHKFCDANVLAAVTDPARFLARSLVVGGHDRSHEIIVSSIRENEVQGHFEIEIPCTTAADAKVHVEYSTEEHMTAATPYFWIPLLPVYEFVLHVEHPVDVDPKAFIFGYTSAPQHENPMPPMKAKEDRPDETWWYFAGWFLKNQGICVQWSQITPPAAEPEGAQTVT